MKQTTKQAENFINRRSFLRKGLAVGGAGAIGTGLLADGVPAFAQVGRKA